jgi:hypothetical protein
MSKDAALAEPSASKPIHLSNALPKPVLAVCVLMIAAGAVLMLARPAQIKSSTFNAMETCDATTYKVMQKVQGDRDSKLAPIENGLSEKYGLIQIKANKAELSRLFTYCETEPALALEIFHRAMKQGNASARTIAAYSTYFLAMRGVLDASDFELLRKCLEKGADAEKNTDLRKVAQRAISDLTVIKSAKDAAKFEVVPASMAPIAAGELDRAIKTNPEKFDGQDVLFIRWSSADVAEAWWTVHGPNGAWDAKLQRFVIP